MAEAIEKRVGKKGTTYKASVYDRRTGKKRRKSHKTLAAARAWRAEALREVERDTLPPARSRTLEEAAGAFLAGIADGSIRDRKQEEYKPGTVRVYAHELRSAILPHLGRYRLPEITKRDVRELMARLREEGRSDSAIRNALDPLRVIYRNAIEDEEVQASPCDGIRNPRRRGDKVEVVEPERAAQLIAALEERDQAVWACAFFAGLRRGEMRALRARDVDLTRRVIHVRRSWDDQAGPVAPKSEAGKRVVPIVEQLRGFLADRLLDGELEREHLVFGRTPTEPFSPPTLYRRSKKTWEAQGLERATFRQARHTFASLLIDAGISNVKAVQEAMGHSSATVTWDTYGHLFPQSRDEVRDRLEGYLAAVEAVPTGPKTGPREPAMAETGTSSREIERGN
jgi:integrase